VRSDQSRDPEEGRELRVVAWQTTSGAQARNQARASRTLAPSCSSRTPRASKLATLWEFLGSRLGSAASTRGARADLRAPAARGPAGNLGGKARDPQMPGGARETHPTIPGVRFFRGPRHASRATRRARHLIFPKCAEDLALRRARARGTSGPTASTEALEAHCGPARRSGRRRSARGAPPMNKKGARGTWRSSGPACGRGARRPSHPRNPMGPLELRNSRRRLRARRRPRFPPAAAAEAPSKPEA